MKINKKQLGTFVAVALFVVGLLYVTNHLIYTVTGSLDYVWFWKSEVTTDIQHNQYISFEFAGDKYYPRKTAFAKRAACLPNDHLQYSDDIWKCNDKPLKNGKYHIHQSGAGENLTLFSYNGIIPDGKYFVLGDAHNSYDSKYWGFVDGDSIRYTLKPLW